MSGHQPSAPQQRKRPKGGSGRESSAGGGRINVHKHAVTNEQAALLSDTVNVYLRDEVKKKAGAAVEFDPNPSPIPGMKIVIIRGVPSEIEAVVRFIHQVTGAQDTISEEAQTFWLQWVEAAFPDLDSRAYFLPPVYFNRVPMTRQSVAGQDVMVLESLSRKLKGVEKIVSLLKSSKIHELQHQHFLVSNQSQTPSGTVKASISQPATVQDSDIRDDAAMRQVLFCLHGLSQITGEVLVGITRLDFRQYLSEPCFAVAAAQLPRASSLPPGLPQNWKQGQFDVLLIHRHYGLVVCNVMSFGDITDKLRMPQEDIDKNIRKKVRDAMSQLDKAEAMLSHLVSDVCPGLRITKTIAIPNLTTDQVQQAIAHDSQLSEALCQCLGTTRDPADIAGVCLCSDQLSDPKTPCDVSSHVLRELGHWWQRRVAEAGPDSNMTHQVYKILVARFCGPATTVSVPCTSPPRVSVKTLGQAVWCTGECYTAVITLFPEQLHLLNTAPPTLFVTGPPGTGKTVVLLLMGMEWLRCGHPVYIVSTCDESRAACIMLYHLLLQTVNTQQSPGVSPGQPHLLQYHLNSGKAVKKAVNDLSQASRGGSLYVIADEVVKYYKLTYIDYCFHTLCHKLRKRVPRLHLWAATCYHGYAPDGWQVEHLTRPLRSPPAVVREVQQDKWMSTDRRVQPYSERGVPDHTDGPPVIRLYHQGQGHSGRCPVNCVTCGREVASFLHTIRVGVTESGTTCTTVSSTIGGTKPPCLQWRDVLVLYWNDGINSVDIVKGLEEAGIPVRVMKDEGIEDVATARSDVVWVASGHHVRGLERKVVVCLMDNDYESYILSLEDESGRGLTAGNFRWSISNALSSPRLDLMSRCTSQLVIVCDSH